MDLPLKSNAKSNSLNPDLGQIEARIDQLTDFIFDLLLGDLVNSEQISKCSKKPHEELEPLFKRNVQSLHNYLNNFSEFVIFSSLGDIKLALNKPRRFPLGELLSSYYTEEGEVPQPDPVLKLEYYLGFEERDFHEVDLGTPGAEARHIIHKCFFDALVEALDCLRVFGVSGMRPIGLKQYENEPEEAELFDEIETITAIERGCNLLLNWNDTLCGFSGREIKQAGGVDDVYIRLLRDERMNKFVFQGVEEENHIWKNFDNEDLEVRVQLSEIVVDYLLADAIEYLNF